jgi:GDP-4-dehydro-6-deoxy-D-mannose reductase
LRVLVTGANGFVGRHLIPALAADGHEPFALALERGDLPKEIPFHGVDIRDADAVASAVAASDPHAVVHLAALSHVGESWRRVADYFQVNVVGTENVLRAAAGRALLLSSSAEVYGTVPESEQPIRESRPPAPRSPYALTKAAAERWALRAGAIVVRCFNLVGEGQARSFALPSFAAQLAAIAAGEDEPLLRVGNLDARRDFVDVLDAVDAFRVLLERGEPGGVYNLASGRARSIAEMLELLMATASVAACTELDPARVRPIDVPLLAGDAGRLEALGWRAVRGVERALRALWSEARAERAAADARDASA